jgi:hypothetical protein
MMFWGTHGRRKGRQDKRVGRAQAAADQARLQQLGVASSELQKVVGAVEQLPEEAQDQLAAALEPLLPSGGRAGLGEGSALLSVGHCVGAVAELIAD